MSSMMHSQLLLICCVIYSVIWTSSAQPCGPYERPVGCIDFCQKCEFKNNDNECFHAAVCIPGCDCLPGFLRNKQNQCIPAAFCPGELPGNVCLQEKDSGPCYGSFKRFYFNKWTGQCEEFIYGGCKGNSNNFKSKGECEAVCKGQCKSDEQYYEDIPDCKNTCENVNNPRPVCPQYFAPRPGCFCATGLVKRKDGKCVRPENCFPPVTCGPNSSPSDCASLCPRTCPREDEEPRMCPAVCVKGCVCNRGFIDDGKGNCIRESQCPRNNKTCGPNEVCSECVNPCNDCVTKGKCEFLVCNKGCDCRPGYRRHLGICIPESQCPAGPPQQCPAGEIPVKCIDRCQRCEYKNGGCVQIGVCTPGCNCQPGFLRDSTNKCIPADFCPGPPQQCPAGEIPVKCIDRCQRCEYKNGGCAQIQVCTPGCNCLPGFLRDSTNKCIPADFCPGAGPGPGTPQQCPPYEYPVGCIDRCQRCEYKNGNCSQIQVCTPGCNCVPGFLRDSTNKCIPADFCPAPGPAQQCGIYEIPVECIDQCQTCKYKNGGCVQPAVCIPGCNCIPGFFRNERNQCVPAASCPALEGGSCRSVGGECMRDCGGAINFGRKDCRKGKKCCLLEK